MAIQTFVIENRSGQKEHVMAERWKEGENGIIFMDDTGAHTHYFPVEDIKYVKIDR